MELSWASIKNEMANVQIINVIYFKLVWLVLKTPSRLSCPVDFCILSACSLEIKGSIDLSRNSPRLMVKLNLVEWAIAVHGMYESSWV